MTKLPPATLLPDLLSTTSSENVQMGYLANMATVVLASAARTSKFMGENASRVSASGVSTVYFPGGRASVPPDRAETEKSFFLIPGRVFPWTASLTPRISSPLGCTHCSRTVTTLLTRDVSA
ncbi:MAG TPA: hypothetical protein PKE00_09420, partial [Planctomycetota bacterium]|nr:hypothetical protein [Planctomycetota bacterium]